MGKLEDDEFTLSSHEAASTVIEANQRRGSRINCKCLIGLIRLINLRCVLALLLGISVFISAIFWLPPFLELYDHGDKDLDSQYRGHAIVASFELQKLVSFVKKNVVQLEADIYYELESANAKVVIISLEGSGSNSTHVVFGIDSVSERSKISETQLSLIQSYFGSFVTEEAKLRLTTSVFGEPSTFEVLKFPGGITIVPRENVYPLQNLLISFNFTLNNSIHQIQRNINALYGQLESGLHLTKQEILYIRLTNSRGSTVNPPATVQTSVVLRFGVPSRPRMKELAKTIKDSPTRNLGLNNTVFGKVKQVSLSSILPAGSACSPSPAPVPSPHFHHQNRHHHNHHHGRDTSDPPVSAPSRLPTRAPQPIEGAPVPWRSYHHVSPPPGVKGRHHGKSRGHSPPHVAVPPSMSHQRPRASSPYRQAKSPTPAVHQIAPSSRLPNVVYARAPPPPSTTGMDAPRPADRTRSAAPLPSSGNRFVASCWIVALLVALSLGLQ